MSEKYKGNADFKKYYCQTWKKNVWVLGYFGGDDIEFGMFKEVAEGFEFETGLDINTIKIGDVRSSRRFRGFKYIYSTSKGQEPLADSITIGDVYKWLTD